MEDQDTVSCILTRLSSPQDRLSASLVCRLWNEALALNLAHLPIRSRTLLPRFLQRFPHIQELDLRRCWDALQDADLTEAAPFLHGIKCLHIGLADNPQVELSDVGFISLACHCPFLEQVVVSSIPQLSDEAVICIAERCPRLRAFSIENCPDLGDAALEAIARCRNLEELTLKGHFNFTSKGLELICNPALCRVRLELGNVRAERALMQMGHSCPHIQEVCLRRVTVDLKGVKFTMLTSLRLEVYDCVGFNEVITEMAAANTGLRELVVNADGSEDVNASTVVAVLKSCHELEKLHTYGTQLTTALLNSVLAHKSLQSLTLVCMRGGPTQDLRQVVLTTLNLKHLSLRFTEELLDAELQLLLECTCRTLKCLDLERCEGISSTSISIMRQCSNLQSLNLSGTAVDNASLKSIADGMRHLKVLDLSGPNSISNFRMVAEFSFLEYLRLDNCRSVNDRVLGVIARGCRRLAHLSLVFTRITDNGLHLLVQCDQLQRLRIAHCARLQAGPGLLAVAKACGWLHYLMISPWSIDAKMLQELNNKFFLYVKLLSDRTYAFF